MESVKRPAPGILLLTRTKTGFDSRADWRDGTKEEEMKKKPQSPCRCESSRQIKRKIPTRSCPFIFTSFTHEDLLHVLRRMGRHLIFSPSSIKHGAMVTNTDGHWWVLPSANCLIFSLSERASVYVLSEPCEQLPLLESINVGIFIAGGYSNFPCLHIFNSSHQPLNHQLLATWPTVFP